MLDDILELTDEENNNDEEDPDIRTYIDRLY